MSTHPSSSTPNVGFTEVFFRSNDLRNILKRKKCSGIRFYNIFQDSTVNLMAVAIRGNADMNRWGLFRDNNFYNVSRGLAAAAHKIKRMKQKSW